MLKYEEALETLLASARERGLKGFQSIPLEDAVGRVVSATILSTEDLPAFANSAMDGFAVAAARTARASETQPVTLPVSAVLAAGDAPSCAAHPGAVEIMTGAPLPPGTDAVIRVEDTRKLDGGASVALHAPAEAGDFVRPRGGDIAQGAPVVEGGTVLEPRHLLALAALGFSRVTVRLRPRVAVISTGKELVPYDQKPGPGQLRNATAPYLAAELRARGAQVLTMASVGDDPGAFRDRLETLLDDDLDLILATGAVSMGLHDYVPASVEQLGAELLFHKTAVRPGKPLLAASFGNGPLFLGLPGNPVSTAMGLRFFVEPLLRFLTGRAPETPLRARLAERVEKPRDLRCFFKGAVTVDEGGARARCLPGQASYQIMPLLAATHWLSLPDGREAVEKDEVVEAYPL
jgi:molybdopterin molybdotransferase